MTNHPGNARALRWGLVAAVWAAAAASVALTPAQKAGRAQPADQLHLACR